MIYYSDDMGPNVIHRGNLDGATAYFGSQNMWLLKKHCLWTISFRERAKFVVLHKGKFFSKIS